MFYKRLGSWNLATNARERFRRRYVCTGKVDKDDKSHGMVLGPGTCCAFVRTREEAMPPSQRDRFGLRDTAFGP